MATADYLDGRVKYRRPQAIIFANNPGTLDESWITSGKTAYITEGETTLIVMNGTSDLAVGQFLDVTSGSGAFGLSATITDVNHDTSVVTVSVAHTATGSIVFRAGSISFVPDGDEFVDFIILSDHNRSPISFKPERIEKRERMVNGRMRSYHIADKNKLDVSWDNLPSRAYPTTPNIDVNGQSTVEPFTVDGGAGGNDLLNWYEENVGSFYVYLAYDKYKQFGEDEKAYGHMNQYNQVIEMYVSDISHTVTSRGGLYDMWDLSISLEEA